MKEADLPLDRTGPLLRPDPRRVLIRPFSLDAGTRAQNMMRRVLGLPEEEVHTALQETLQEFADRHIDIEDYLRKHYEQARALLEPTVDIPPLSPERELFIGSYFTSEFALESAALFNPSIVPAPDREEVPEGSLRFVMSLRATGEGHISSIEFRSGIIDSEGGITIDPVGATVAEPDKLENAEYDRRLFLRTLGEMECDNEYSHPLIEQLPPRFTLAELQERLHAAWRDDAPPELRHTHKEMWLLALANYEVRFQPDQPLSERIIFPSSPSEQNGIEDARFVAFEEDDGSTIYYATYTAYDGSVIFPQLMETRDFLHFKVCTLNGPAARNKGMALFPRRIDGRYAMISRQDNENVYIMFSDHLHFWYDAQPLFGPRESWELVQMGNCGSPIETEAGWLLLTHGVGPMRRYCISALLLDLEDPTRVIGRMRDPLLEPDENEREGYVPNVVYTCGALVHAGHLILPYAMSDFATSFATVPLADLLDRLRPA